MKLRILSGGAAQALVAATASRFKEATGLDIEGEFGAVWAMKAKLLGGDSADLLILTRALVGELAAAGRVNAASMADIGVVRTAVAVREADPPPAIASAADLRAALLTADAIYSPDQAQATAGIHFRRVLEALGIWEEVAGRLRTYPNGATAMRALAASAEGHPIGCTQVTEILATPGLRLVGPLPAEFELATAYTAGVVAGAPNAEAAGILAAMLAAPDAQLLRERLGFGA